MKVWCAARLAIQPTLSLGRGYHDRVVRTRLTNINCGDNKRRGANPGCSVSAQSLNETCPMDVDEFLKHHEYKRGMWAKNEGGKHIKDWSPTYVRPTQWSSLVGMHTAVLLYAPRGAGKTALRRMVESHFENEATLVISHIDVKWVVDKVANGADVPADLHVLAVARAGLRQLSMRVATSSNLPKLPPTLKHRFLRLIDHLDLDLGVERWSRDQRKQWNRFCYSWGPLSRIRVWLGRMWRRTKRPAEVVENSAIGENYLATIIKTAALAITAKDSLGLTVQETLLEIANHLGFDNIFVSVNSIDEIPGSSEIRRPEAIARITRQLLNSPPILEAKGYSWRIYLPQHSQSMLSKETRADERLPVVTLEWTEDELARILGSRLRAFRAADTQLAPVESTQQASEEIFGLFDETAWREYGERFISAANQNPRRLFRICEEATLRQLQLDPQSRIGEQALVHVLEWIPSYAYRKLRLDEQRVLERYLERLAGGRQHGDAWVMTSKDLRLSDELSSGVRGMEAKAQIVRHVRAHVDSDLLTIADTNLVRWLEEQCTQRNS